MQDTLNMLVKVIVKCRQIKRRFCNASATTHRLSIVLPGELFSTDLNPRWRRPHAPSLDPSSENLVFQQIDLDYYLGKNQMVSSSHPKETSFWFLMSFNFNYTRVASVFFFCLFSSSSLTKSTKLFFLMSYSIFVPLQAPQWQECPASRKEKSQLFECLE